MKVNIISVVYCVANARDSLPLLKWMPPFDAGVVLEIMARTKDTIIRRDGE